MEINTKLSANINSTNSMLNNSLLNEIEIVFKTNLPEELRVEPINLTIPLNSQKENLNKILSKLLASEQKETDKKFEFFIDNKILDEEIGSFMITNKVAHNTEQVLEVFYFFELSEPQLINTIKEDEWIRRIRTLHQDNEVGKYCVGLFNGEVSFYDQASTKLMTINHFDKENNDFIVEMLHDIQFIKTNGKHILLLASKSEEENVSVYEINFKAGSSKKIGVVQKESNEYVNCLAENPADSSFFCTGSSTGQIQIYKLDEVTGTDKPKTNKRQRTECRALTSTNEILRAHNTDIKVMKWINNMQIVTSGDDFSVKVWNTSTNANYCSFNSSYKVATALAAINQTDGLLAGYDDGKIRTWDIRAPGANNGISFVGHKNRVSEIQVNPLLSQCFISTAYDKTLKVWDLRSTKPLYDLTCDGEKNFGLAFNYGKQILSGGDNAAVRMYEMNL